MEEEKFILLKKLGKRVRKMRKERGLSQTELANNINKDQPSIQRLEAGNINPSFYYLHQVAQGLNIPFKELVDF